MMRAWAGLRNLIASTGILLGVIAGPTPSLAQSATQYTGWQTVVEDDGAGVMTTYSDGSVLALVVVDDVFQLVLKDPAWNFTKGARIPIAIVIDGERYSGTAVAFARDMIDAPVSDRGFVVNFAAGDEAVVEILGARWEVNLSGTTHALKTMIRAMGD